MTESSGRPRLLIAILRLAPAGGLEQHVIRLAEALRGRGADVTLLTTRLPPGGAPEGVRVILTDARGRTNHGRLAAFASDAAKQAWAGAFDRTVAAHAIPGFQTLFLADPSRSHPRGVRAWLPRYRTFASLEDEAFGRGGASLALFLAGRQRAGFVANHPGSQARFELLPPTVDARRRSGSVDPADAASARQILGLPPAAPVWLWMGLQPYTKGLDRALAALAASGGEAHLIVSGLDPRSRGGSAMRRRAERLGVGQRVAWLGFAEPATLETAFSAADLLVHPSRADVTGTVILEAMAHGLPVITTAVCGYSEHVARASAGVVLAEPVRAASLMRALASADADALRAWSCNAAAYAAHDELYRGIDAAADLILDAPGRPPSAQRAEG